MKKAIYKITNKINKKIYIGQSIHPEQRFQEHCSASRRDNILVDHAIKKYGKEHFELEILGWYEDFDDKEKYYIKLYHSLVPDGYNLLEGGNKPPYKKGEEVGNHKLTQKQVNEIYDILMNNWAMNWTAIGRKYNVSRTTIIRINRGEAWYNEQLNYPLRPTKREQEKIRGEKIVKLLQETKLSHRDIAKKVGVSKSLVTMINNDKIPVHHRADIDYPIRK